MCEAGHINMTREILAAALCIVTMLASAAQAETAASPAAAVPAGAAGAVILSGNAFAIAPGGEAVGCAGREVVATPDGGATPAAVHRAVCDPKGHFVFHGLTASGWTIRTTIMWEVRAKQGIRRLGGEIARHVVLRPGGNAIAIAGRPGAAPNAEELATSQAPR
jgi:hypothetical protein